MTANIHITVHVKAWMGLLHLMRDRQPHKRQSYQEFSVTQYLEIPGATPNAKGLSSYLLELLFSSPYGNSEYHLPTPPYSILPNSFVDQRSDAIKEEDYAMFGEPGEQPELDRDILALARNSGLPQYTHWGHPTETDKIIRGLTVPHLSHVLAITSVICDYWHLSATSGAMPHSPQEKFAAFLNAFGWHYLYHPLRDAKPAELPRTAANVDAAVAEALDKAKIVAARFRSAELWQPRGPRENYTRKHNYKCNTTREATRTFSPIPGQAPDTFNYKCNKPADYILRIGSSDNPICRDCEYERTIELPYGSYQLLDINTYEPPIHPGSAQSAKPKSKPTNKRIKLIIHHKEHTNEL